MANSDWLTADKRFQRAHPVERLLAWIKDQGSTPIPLKINLRGLQFSTEAVVTDFRWQWWPKGDEMIVESETIELVGHGITLRCHSAAAFEAAIGWSSMDAIEASRCWQIDAGSWSWNWTGPVGMRNL